MRAMAETPPPHATQKVRGLRQRNPQIPCQASQASLRTDDLPAPLYGQPGIIGMGIERIHIHVAIQELFALLYRAAKRQPVQVHVASFIVVEPVMPEAGPNAARPVGIEIA